VAQVRIGVRAGGRSGVLRRTGIVAAVASLALLAAGCHGSGGSGQASAGGQTITVAAVSGIDTAPLTVAQKHGIFSSHGLTVQVHDYSTPAAAYSALTNGGAQVAVGDYTEFFDQLSQPGSPSLKLLADAYDATAGTTELMTLPNSRVTSPGLLAGQTVATPEQDNPAVKKITAGEPYNIETLATDSVLQSEGLSPARVNWQPTPGNQLLSELADHRVAAILVPEPYIVQAETQLGAVELLDSCSGITANLPMAGYFSTARYARHDPTALRAFQAALSTAQADSGDRMTVQGSLSGMSAQDAALVTIGQYPSFLNAGQVQRVADLMFDSGMTSNELQVRSLLFR
jgi:NitT/TauT family transport system substrate-binding protein